MTNFTTILPVAALIAVLLFILKESIEWIRRHNADGRKKKALRLILARECERNHWSINSIRGVLETIKEKLTEEPPPTFRFIFPKSGKTLFRVVYPGDEMTEGSALAETYQDIFNKYLLDVATLDKTLYEDLQRACDAIAEVEHVRQSLIYYVNPEIEDDEELIDGFV